MDRSEEVSLLQVKDQQIMKLQADMSMKNSQITNLQFCLKLRDDQLRQMRLALVENQTKKSVFMTKLQLTTRELKSASSNRKKLSQQYYKSKVASGLEIAHLKSLLSTKDNVDSLSNAKEGLVRKPVEENFKTMKSEVKPFFSCSSKNGRLNRKEVIERCLPKAGAEYEMLLIQMEEGTLCNPSKSIDTHRIKGQQQSTMLEESALKNKLLEKSPCQMNTISKESPKPVILEESPENSSKESSKLIIFKESPQVTNLPTKEITSSKNYDQQQQQQQQQMHNKITKSLTMEDLGLFGNANQQAQIERSYEQSLTMEQLGLFGGKRENKEDVVEFKENVVEDEDGHAIDLLLKMEEGLIQHSHY